MGSFAATGEGQYERIRRVHSRSTLEDAEDGS